MRRTPVPPLPALAVLAAVGASVLGGCGGRSGGGTVSGAVPTSTSAPSSTAAAAATSTTASPGSTIRTGAKDVRDWDGVRFDIGVLDRIDRTEDGKTLVVFDRMQLTTAGGTKTGKDFTAEPIVYGNTDAPLTNDSTRLRTYVAGPGIEVLRLANLRQTCADQAGAAAPRWAPVTVDQVVDQSLWRDYPQVSLTFSTDGLVTRLRLSSGC